MAVQSEPHAKPELHATRGERGGFVRGLFAGALLAFCATGALVLFLRTPQPQPLVVHAPPVDAIAPTQPQTMTVYVAGAVARPGVYVLDAGARVEDALARAGGLLAGAEAAKLNLALALNDGSHIYAPEATTADPQPGESDSASTRGASVTLGNVVNLNVATLEQLMELPGIGEVRAREIMAGRPYTSIEDLDRVSGIGAATLEKLRPLVSVP